MSSSALLLPILISVAKCYNASYQPRPYTINVDPTFIEDTRVRASNFRPSLDIDAPAWFDGPPVANVSEVAEYWASDFNFDQFQNELNTNFSHFITTVPPPGEMYNRSLDIHFIHEVSDREDAIPMLLLHGWPSTSLEWAKVIPSLAHPPNSSLPAFHAVAPDLPGFGFSPAPTTPGLNPEGHAIVFASLMEQLGYERYVVYSTDLGFVVAQHMVPKYVDRIINHVTDFYLVFQNATDSARFANNQTTPEETAYISSQNDFLANHGGYSDVHSTLPLSLAHTLLDSPVGFLAWMWQLVYTVSDVPQTAEELIRRALALYIPGPYGNIRSYKELFGINLFTGVKTKVPVSAVQWGYPSPAYPALKDFNYAPRDWVERTANLTYFKRLPVGGHFPAESRPQLWIETIWEIFAAAV
ncbi:alpha/beta-hydrolase [Pseudovirgaria hyperparasitica]|uniref:Alpha/beta-hydrolase n=1 Tax=Pseudovirgaria hyperparasitica TaxID=470096 RepID=A0A6A6WCE5_9PEZI|nr:alpha/beta-hydrolase [Pseudovirgaria hyperparasitica]KAF2760245.1 alpha/beta-hydrolase [Pseudovirgaria hyperparasitica]